MRSLFSLQNSRMFLINLSQIRTLGCITLTIRDRKVAAVGRILAETATLMAVRGTAASSVVVAPYQEGVGTRW